MADLQAALRMAGLHPSAQAQAEAEVDELNRAVQKDAEKKRSGENDRRFQTLRETESVNTFRREARRILWVDSSYIHEIVKIAHDSGMKKKSPKLISRLLGLRNALGQTESGRKKGELIDDALVRGW